MVGVDVMPAMAGFPAEVRREQEGMQDKPQRVV
jgi:hypothetical protein